jgi:hypothetical protein
VGKYDSLRQTVSGSGTSSIDTSSSSKYDDLKMTMGLIDDTRPKPPKLDRADLLRNDRVDLINQGLDPNPKFVEQPKPGKEWQQDSSRQLPVIGPILRGLDAFGNNPIVEKVGEIGRALYVPGGGLGNIASLTGAAENAVARTLPKLAPVAQKGISEVIANAPLGAGQTQMTNPDASVKDLLTGAAIGGAAGGVLGVAGKGLATGMKKFSDNAVTGLSRNAIQNVAENSRSSVTSPFAEGAAAGNPIARGYTENVSRTFNPKLNQGIDNITSDIPKPPLADIAPINPQREEILNERVAPVSDDLIQVKEPRIRDKVVTFLDDAEKAARARIAERKGRLNSLPVDEWADHAVILAAQIGKGGIKLADATEYLVREFGESIRPHASNVLNQARNIAKEAERRASKEAQEARAFNESVTGDANSFSGKVSRDLNKNRTPFAKRMEKLRSQLVDDQAPLEGLEKRIRGKVSSAENSLSKSARLFRGVPEKANQIVKDRLAPIVNGIEKKGYSSSQLGDYALAVHARDVNARDIKSGFTNKEINDVISRLGNPEMEVARKELIKISDDMLQELVDNGVISATLMKTLKERYPNYMPLFRAFDDQSVNFADGLSNSLANVTAPIKGLKGSERQVVDPLENMVKNIFQSTNAAERNKVSQQLAKLAEEDVDSKFIRRLDDYEDVGRKNVVSVLQNGEKVRYEVEPEVYKALLNLDKESSNMVIKVLQKPASVLRAGATLTPEFSLRNPLRDVVQAFVTSKSGFNPLIDFPVGLIQSISKGDLYKQWVKELGAYGNIISNDRQVHNEALDRVLKEPISKKFVNIVNGKSLIKILRSISDTTESATKVGEFRAALRKGATPQEAAYRSRDTMDFGRAGSAVRGANKVVAFLNANIQGKSKLLRSFKENPAGFSARAFSAITVPTVGIFLMQKYMANDAQKQTIDESPNWLKDTFWLVPVPGTDQVARIPKPFDLNVLFSNLPERALNYTYNNDKESFDGFAKKAMADSALPGMISALTPMLEGMANFSTFRGGSIIPQSEYATRNFEDQYDINTTETAKLLAKGAGKIVGNTGLLKNFGSPRIMDNTIKGYTAGLGTYATSAIDVMLDKFGVTDNPVRPAKGPAQQPLAKAFLVNPNQSGKSTEKLYDLKDKLTRNLGSAKLNDKPFVDNPRLDGITSQTDIMAGITKQIRFIEKSMTLSPEAKRDQIDMLIKQRNDLARKTYQVVK